MREHAYILILGVALAAAALGPLASCDSDAESPTGASSSKEITAFSFLKTDNPMLSHDVVGVIYQDTGIIALEIYHALPCHEYPLVATFATTGRSVVCRGEAVISGVTAVRYVPWRVLIVQAEDGSSKDYTIRVRQKLDAFIANAGPDEPNLVWYNAGSGLFNDSMQRLSDQESYAVALGDLDGDGDLDIFEANAASTANVVWLNDGNGTLTDSGQSLGAGNSRCAALGNLRGPPEVLMQH